MRFLCLYVRPKTRPKQAIGFLKIKKIRREKMCFKIESNKLQSFLGCSFVHLNDLLSFDCVHTIFICIYWHRNRMMPEIKETKTHECIELSSVRKHFLIFTRNNAFFSIQFQFCFDFTSNKNRFKWEFHFHLSPLIRIIYDCLYLSLVFV